MFWLRFWRYNFQPVLFVVLYCCLTIAHMVIYLQGDIEQSNYEDGEIEHYSCVLFSAYNTDDLNAGIKACGTHAEPRLPLYHLGTFHTRSQECEVVDMLL